MLADSRKRSFVTFCWAVAGRTLVRQLAFKKEAQDELGEATLKQEISVILSAMRMFSERRWSDSPERACEHADRGWLTMGLAGNALGVVVTKALQSLMDDPNLCHPKHNGGIAMAQFCDHSPIATGATPGTSTESSSGHQASSTAATSELHTDSTLAPSPSVMFSELLWELEQPGTQISENENFKKMELDLRSLIGPSYDQLLNLTPDDFPSMTAATASS